MSKRTVFVSHAHADNAICDRYVTAMRDRGFDIWYDRSDLQAGSHLSADIQRELTSRTAFVVFLTPASVNSYWVQLETDGYRALMVQDDSRMMLPVRVAPCDVPVLLEPLTWIDAVNQPFERIIDAMARALETDPSARRPVKLARGAPGRGRRIGRIGLSGALLIASLCVLLLAVALLSLGAITGKLHLPLAPNSGNGSSSTATPGQIVVTKNQTLACDQDFCGEPYFQLTLHTVTADTNLHDVKMEWIVTDKSANPCPRVNLWDGHLQDPHGNQIAADDYEGTGNFQLDPNQSVTRGKIYKALPQLDTPYTFFMQMPTGCSPIFGGDQNGYSYTFTFKDNYQEVDVAHVKP